MFKSSNYVVSVGLIVLMMLTLGSTFTLAQSNTAQDLINLLTRSSCASACYLGIEAGRTTQAEVRSIFGTEGISYTVLPNPTGLTEANGMYTWQLPANTPFIDPQSQNGTISFANGIVARIDIPIQIPTTTLIEAFGAPTTILVSSSPTPQYFLVYESRNAIFLSGASTGPSQVGLIFLLLPGSLTLNFFTGGDTPITSANCSQVPQEICNLPRLTSSGTGLRGAYFDNANFTGLRYFQLNPTLNFNWGTGSPDAAIAADTFSVRWTGRIEPLFSETYTFFVTHNDGARLWVNNQQIINNWANRTTSATTSGTITLAGGARYDIRLDYFDNTGAAEVRLEWQSTSQARQMIPASQLYGPERQMLVTATVGANNTNSEIFVVNANGTSAQNLSNNAADDYAPMWSPDGTQLAFMSARSGNDDIWVIRPDGTCLRRITNHASIDALGSWSPDGTRLAFRSDRTGGGDIYVVTVPTACNASVPAATLLPGATTEFEDGPVWSPNGLSLLYVRFPNISSSVIMRMNANGTSRTAVASGVTNTVNGNPQWSPDGNLISFRTQTARFMASVSIYNLTTGQTLCQIISTPLLHQIQWSPDNTQIAFQQFDAGTATMTITSSACGTPIILSGPEIVVNWQKPSWSPDSRFIAYVRDGNLWVMNRDGSNQHLLMNTTDRIETGVSW